MSEIKNYLREYLKRNPLVGQLGTFENLKLLGEGGNGLVFAAELHDVPVAVKFLVEAGRSKPTRFKAEYLNVATLPANRYVSRPLHYEEFRLGERAYPAIIMKRYEGPLQRPQQAELEGLQKLFDFLVAALRFIHRQEIIHRDLKPENILVEGASLALSDFGIASFNPEVFRLRAETRKDERINNRLFSAPEQARGGATAHPTMDIFALGQLCQWYATGSTHVGTGRERLTAQVPGADLIDAVVDKCLAHNPTDRYQSADDLAAAYKALADRRVGRGVKQPFDYMHIFGDVLSAAFPRDIKRVAFTDDPMRIRRLLTDISERDFKEHLWWTDGYRSNPCRLIRLDEDTWLLGRPEAGDEIRVESVWAYYDEAYHADFLLLNLAPIKPFGIYEPTPPEAYEGTDLTPSEEAVLVDDSFYVFRNEYDSGYAEVNGETIRLSDHSTSIRQRYLAPHSVFLATEYNAVLHRLSEDEVIRLMKPLRSGDTITANDLKSFVQKIRKNKNYHR